MSDNDLREIRAMIERRIPNANRHSCTWWAPLIEDIHTMIRAAVEAERERSDEQLAQAFEKITTKVWYEYSGGDGYQDVERALKRVDELLRRRDWAR